VEAERRYDLGSSRPGVDAGPEVEIVLVNARDIGLCAGRLLNSDTSTRRSAVKISEKGRFARVTRRTPVPENCLIFWDKADNWKLSPDLTLRFVRATDLALDRTGRIRGFNAFVGTLSVPRPNYPKR
jgi:hypothetical protein